MKTSPHKQISPLSTLRQTFACKFLKKNFNGATGGDQDRSGLMRETMLNPGNSTLYNNQFRIKRLSSKEEVSNPYQINKNRLSGLPVANQNKILKTHGRPSAGVPSIQEEDQQTTQLKKIWLKPYQNMSAKDIGELENYEIKNKIEEGAFAEVKLAINKVTKAQVVVKIYDRIKLLDKHKKQNVKNEIAILRQADHPNIIKILDVVEGANTINIVMEYLQDCTTLKGFLNANSPLKESQLKTIIKQLASGLLYLHDNAICHRDIKLENVLVSKDLSYVKFIDFGFAVKADKSSYLAEGNFDTDRGTIFMQYVGTPAYMCPEIINKKNYNPYKADIWALGVLFYYLYSGFLPFRGNDTKTLYKKINKGEVSFPYDVHPGCEYLMRKMLNPDPEERIEAGDILKNTWIKPVNFMDEINKLKHNTSSISS